ncbi:hypothetical protein KUTeg_023438 [Tegillarca granosa]|uniref:Phosphatidic acid phosphatase type 2/haloperoxidase domain-containing protein n=1 Tax=Tegillarca granosa TaxID=220873 RepID=A0ABQ9E1N9_TEGGR|nr:hypothetical protein KUTeg_023438 [Tegillarca granosa]
MGWEQRTTCTKRQILMSFIDIVIVGLVALPLLLFNQLATPFHRGFFCDDESIRYPYKDSTISSSVLYSVGFVCNILAKQAGRLGNESTNYQQHPEQQNDQSKSVNHYFCAVFTILLPFMFGATIEHLTTDIAKYQIGRLRPHFIDVCKPDYSSFSCNDTIGYRYVEDDVCTGDKKLLREARLSFPSGHASFSSYAMVFLVLYIQYKFTWKKVVLLKPLLQVLFLYMTYYTCLSRVSDNKHHWSDVLFGALIGFDIYDEIANEEELPFLS